MPPIRTKNSRNSIEQEGRLLLAIQAIKKQEIHSIREAVRCFNVPKSTLLRCLNNTPNQTETRANNHKLTEIEEESLQKWIICYNPAPLITFCHSSVCYKDLSNTMQPSCLTLLSELVHNTQ